MAVRIQPTPEYLEALAVRSLNRHRASVAGNSIRAMFANAGMYLLSIERAAEEWGWPFFESSSYITALVNAAMVEVLHNGRDLGEAVATLPRVKRGSRGSRR